MAESSDIYRQFVATPLRLKSHHPRSSPLKTPVSPPSTCSSFTDATCVESPGFPGRSNEVSRLRRRVAKFRISTEEEDGQSAEKRQERVETRSDTESSAGTSPAGVAASGTLDESRSGVVKTLLKKKKRVTRAVTMQNNDTGGEFVDTPTKATKPPKRSRKFSYDSTEEVLTAFSLSGALSEDEDRDEAVVADKSASTTRRKSMTVMVQTRPLRRSRRLQGVKLESPKITVKPATAESSVEEAAVQTTPDALTAVSAAVETPVEIPVAVMPVDWISPLCDPLLSTNTISGCFFALSLNSLRAMQYTLIPTDKPSESNPFEGVFTICQGIAQCEKLAQRSFPPPSSKMKAKSVSPRRKHGGGRSVKKTMKTKKSVRFQSFDLSCLNLQYVDDEHVATMVEEILTRYGAIMEHVETMVSNRDDGVDELAKTILRELARMMASPSELYSSSAPDGAVEMGAWKKIYRRAYGGRDSYSQHEIRICGEYFARQFANLLSPRVPSPLPPQFLQSVFSSLASSSVRFKLRELFVANENFEENIDERNSRELLDEDGKPFPAMAPYEHQDLGAAIHWALQESLLYESLVQPLHDVLKQREVSSPADGGPDAESSVAMYLDENAPEDLDHMEKYVLARRFLRFHITRSWRHRCEGDNDAGKTWASIEKVCAVAKRFNFEDEVHLFPLASVDEFVGTLAREETTLQQIQEALQSFYEQKYGLSALHPESCMECHHTITREENPTSIRCTSCASRFHLGCLHLPESFAQYAEHYICPSCFLGRGGY